MEKQLCQMPSAGFSNVMECPNQGREWPGIDLKLCRHCFKIVIVDQQWDLLCRVEEEYIKYRDLLYMAEVADGLRPAPSHETYERMKDVANRIEPSRKRVVGAVRPRDLDDEGAI